MKLDDLVKLKPLIEAIERGETIQYEYNNGWSDVSHFCGDIDNFIGCLEHYRVKPKPREWYEIHYLRTDTICSLKFSSRELAIEWIRLGGANSIDHVSIMKVREVLDT
jgi:hypothetical protein